MAISDHANKTFKYALLLVASIPSNNVPRNHASPSEATEIPSIREYWLVSAAEQDMKGVLMGQTPTGTVI
jgi:hypothetical protein